MSNKWPPLCLLESAQVAYRSVVASFLASRRMLHECVLVLAKYPALLIASYAASASGRQCTRRCTIFRIETINSMLWRAKFLPTFGASLGSTRRFQIEHYTDDCCIDGTWFVGKESARWKRNPSAALPSCNGRVCRA